MPMKNSLTAVVTFTLILQEVIVSDYCSPITIDQYIRQCDCESDC